MATVSTNPSGRDDTGVDAGGWAIAVATILSVIGVGAYLWFQSRDAARTAVTPAATETADLDTRIPDTGASAGSSL